MIELIKINQHGKLGNETAGIPLEFSEVIEVTIALYETEGFEEPWISYAAKSNDNIVGLCSFKSPPRQGRVEIAYFTFPAFEGKGLGTAMAENLLKIARAAEPDIGIFAQTLPVDSASTAILTKLGFTLTGTVQHPEDGMVWEWET